MFGQTFATGDIPVVLILVLLEGLLSADNALVLAIMVRHLPASLQRKALLYGLGGAFVFRLVAIVLATQIIQLWWLQLIGALYLLWLPVKHFRHIGHESGPKKITGGFWATVFAVELADIAFAVDSVVAAVALVNTVNNPDKIWVVYLGAVMGVVLLRFVAGLLIGLLNRLPFLEHLAYALVAWVGVKLAFMAGHNFSRSDFGEPYGLHIPEMNPIVFWSVMAVLVIGGTWIALQNQRQVSVEDQRSQEMIEDVSDLVIDSNGVAHGEPSSPAKASADERKSP